VRVAEAARPCRRMARIGGEVSVSHVKWPPRARKIRGRETVWIVELRCQDGRILPAAGAEPRLTKKRALADAAETRGGSRVLKYGVARYRRMP
jgi:hypothetical protein